MNTQGALELMDEGLRRRTRIAKQNSASTVVWNPWADGSRALRDLGAEEWRNMLCVEPSNVLECAFRLPPGDTYTMTVRIAVTPL